MRSVRGRDLRARNIRAWRPPASIEEIIETAPADKRRPSRAELARGRRRRRIEDLEAQRALAREFGGLSD